MREIKRLLLVTILSSFLFSCNTQPKKDSSSLSSSSSGTTSISSSSSTTSKPEQSFEDKLKSLSSVKKVEKLNIFDLRTTFKEIYEVYFEQQLNWKDSSKGTFLQRARIFYNGDNEITQYKANGYLLGNESSYTADSFGELFDKYKGNYVDLEYRMFGKSHPSDFKIDEVKYYEYQTSYNASNDFHNIVSSLSTVLKGKKIFTGGSKGGYTTEAMAYYYPNDIDAYISYVAPLCDGISDSRFMNNINTTIGDLTYGTTKAKEYRDLMLNFQKTVLSDKFREKIKAEVMDYSPKEGYAKMQVSEDELYEIAVLEVVTNVWQYYQQFSRISEALEMPEVTEEDIDFKVFSLKSFFDEAGVQKTLYVDNVYTPYYVQSYIEMGAPTFDLDYLRNNGANVKTLKERDSSLMFGCYISKAQKEALSYDNSMRNNLINFFNTTTKDIVKIYGLSDTWYAVKAPSTTNSHIHVFEAKASHVANISSLEETDKNACWSVIDNLVK